MRRRPSGSHVRSFSFNFVCLGQHSFYIFLTVDEMDTRDAAAFMTANSPASAAATHPAQGLSMPFHPADRTRSAARAPPVPEGRRACSDLERLPVARRRPADPCPLSAFVDPGHGHPRSRGTGASPGLGEARFGCGSLCRATSLASSPSSGLASPFSPHSKPFVCAISTDSLPKGRGTSSCSACSLRRRDCR